MKVTALGTGGMFTTKNFNSNFLYEMDDDTNLLVDCGSDIKWSLKEAGKSYKDIDAIFLSHLHSDHSGGTEYIGFCKYFDPSQTKPKLFISKLLVDDLWSALKPSMASYQGKILTLQDYFDVEPIELNKGFIFGSVKFDLVQTFHIMDGYRIVPSFGLKFKYGKNRVFFTSDTQFNKMLSEFYNEATVILQEVETSDFESGVHCHIDKLLTLSGDIRSKMILYHYGDDVVDGTYKHLEKLETFRHVLGKGDVIKFSLEENEIIRRGV